MNLANKLTILRIILIPLFLLALYLLPDAYNELVAIVIFAVASTTDWLDGYIARTRNMITTFGKFMDPLADKLLVVTALIYFTEVGLLPAWVVIIIVARELLVSGFRILAVQKGVVIAASWWGKIKTATTMIMIIVLLIQWQNLVFNAIKTILVVATTVFTIISFIDYIIKNKGVFYE